jgi:hypothetical protein
MNEVDDKFYDRADAHIHLSNDQISKEIGTGKVSASMMFATARFNAYLSAKGYDSAADFSGEKSIVMKYFVDEYTKMLEENIDDYIESFDNYMKPEE